MRFDSQFARMNCQIFSCGLSSGARSGREWSRGRGWEVGGVTVYVASKSRHWPFWAALRAAGVRGAPGLLPGPMRSQAGWLG